MTINSSSNKNNTVLCHKQLDNVDIADGESSVPLTLPIVQFISTHLYDYKLIVQ